MRAPGPTREPTTHTTCPRLAIAGATALSIAAATFAPAAAHLPRPTRPAGPTTNTFPTIQRSIPDRASRATPRPAATAPRDAAPRHSVASPSARPAPRRTTRQQQPPALPPVGGGVATVIRFALAQVGDPYVWGAAGPASWDCSGLVMVAYAQVGIHLPHNSGGMLAHGRPVSRAQLQPGDLVFPNAGHVSIYLGGGRVVEAAHQGVPVRVVSLWGFWTARRLL